MKNISRRSFLKTGAVAAAGLTIVTGSVLGKSFGYTAPSDKLNIAGIGVGGMGRRNLANMSTENIVALCDVDWHDYGSHPRPYTCRRDRPRNHARQALLYAKTAYPLRLRIAFAYQTGEEI